MIRYSVKTYYILPIHKSAPLLHLKGYCPHSSPALPSTSLNNAVILSERSESKNLPIYGLLIRNSRAKILRLASLAQDDILNLAA